MTGAGNDFVLMDNRAGQVVMTRGQVARLCHRHFGIGADGLMLLVPSSTGRADWAWQFWNSDGSAAEMCGNGARCFARFIRKVTGWDRPSVTFETAAGIIEGTYDGELVSIRLTPPRGLRLGDGIETSGGPLEVDFVNTGVPHAVVFVPDADRAMVLETGAELRRHPHFGPAGTNVNFVEVLEPGWIRVRTFERGVEGETLACGTGVTASALVSARRHSFPSPVRVRVQGGDELSVSFTERDGQFDNVCLKGPATFVFEGRIEL